MYTEFLYSIFDYYRTLDKRTIIYEIILPFVFGGLVFYILYFKGDLTRIGDYRENVLTLLGVLVGFSITIITILTTGTSKNLNEIKQRPSSKKLGSIPLSLFDILLINFTYSVVLEILLIIVHLIYPFILSNYKIDLGIKTIVFSIIFSTVIHVLLLTIRNMTDFYLILLKR